MFINYAHRGASSYAPENTMAAYRMGVDMGADGIELDLQETADGEIVIFHDDRIDRKSNGTGRIADHTYQELLCMDFGGWFSEKYAGEKIVRFADFMKVYGPSKLHLAVELKVTGIAEKALPMILMYRPGYERVRITSFLYEALAEVHAADAGAPTGWLTDRISEEKIRLLAEIGACQICPAAESVTGEDISLAKAAGLEVRLWGVRNTELMEKGCRLGADGMTVNFPDLLTSYLEEKII